MEDDIKMDVKVESDFIGV